MHAREPGGNRRFVKKSNDEERKLKANGKKILGKKVEQKDNQKKGSHEDMFFVGNPSRSR